MEYNIKNLTSYLHRVTDRVGKYLTAIRADLEQNVVSWDECQQLAETANLAEWIGYEIHHLDSLAKEQHFSFGHLYRCKKSDPLQVIKQGKIYRLREWKDTYIVCGEGFAIGKHLINEHFERVAETEEASKIVKPKEQ